jgi:hypothetical protein
MWLQAGVAGWPGAVSGPQHTGRCRPRRVGRHKRALGEAWPPAGGAGRLHRARSQRGGAKMPFILPSMLPLLSSPLAYFFSPSMPCFLGAVSPGPDHAGGFLWRWDLASPTTFYPCGFKHPSPDALCVFRRQPEGLSEATPSIRRLLCKARKNNGPPPPAPRPKPDSTPTDRSRRFEFCTLWYYPGFEEAPQRNE